MRAFEPIFLYGAGGHGRSAAEVIRRQGRYRIACVLDDDPGLRGTTAAATVIGGREKLSGVAADGIHRGFVSIGNNADREDVAALAGAAGLSFITAVDPAAVVAEGARIGRGTILMPLTVVAAGARLGRGVIVNTSASVDHDCTVEDFAHISPGVHMVGGCRIGARSTVGIGAVLGRAVTLGDGAVVGAGAVVLHDVAPGVVVAGVPARPLTSSVPTFSRAQAGAERMVSSP